MSDSGMTYRTRDEIAERRKSSDPLVKLGKVILDYGLATKEELEVSAIILFRPLSKPPKRRWRRKSSWQRRTRS